MSIIAIRWSKTHFMEVEPAPPGQKLAHLHQAHGIVHVVQGLGGFAPVFGKKLPHNHEPSESQHEDNMG